MASSAHSPVDPQASTSTLPQRNWVWFLVRGVLALILGVLSILFPFGALFAFALVFAAFAFVDGVASLVSGIRGARDKAERWGSMVFRGLIGVAVGVLFIAWPLTTTVSYALVTLVMLIVWSLATGVLEIVAAVRLRREIKGEWLLALSGVLSILLGFAILFFLLSFPQITILSVGWMIGVYALAAGVALIVLSFRLRGRGQAAKA